MNKGLKTVGLLIVIISLITMMTSCEKVTYYHFNHTAVSGWEKNDTLIYDIPPLSEPGTYREYISLRIGEAYPFKSVFLIIEQKIFPGKRMICDTISYNLVNEKGERNGYGISHYQYNYLLREKDFRRGDSLHITIRHDMKREILPGISDIGFKLSPKH